MASNGYLTGYNEMHIADALFPCAAELHVTFITCALSLPLISLLCLLAQASDSSEREHWTFGNCHLPCQQEV